MTLVRSARWLSVWGTTLGLVQLPAALAAQQPERHTLSGNSIAIYNLVGRMSVSGGTGNEVRVTVTRSGPDAARLRVETGAIDNHDRQWQALRVVYPADRIVAPTMGERSRTELKVRGDGTFGDAGRTRGSRVVIAGSGSGLRAGADLDIVVPPGKQIGLYLAVGRVNVTNVEGDLRVDVAHAPVTVQGVTGELTIDSGSGTVDVRDVQGDASVETGSGAVTVAGVRAEQLSVETGSGGVKASEITAQTVSVETGSGRVELQSLSVRRASVETGSGSVTLDLVKNPDRLDIETGSGSVLVQAPASLSAKVDLETSSGRVESDFPITVRQHRREAVRGTIGDGAGQIRIETGSGSVRLVRRS